MRAEDIYTRADGFESIGEMLSAFFSGAFERDLPTKRETASSRIPQSFSCPSRE